MTEQKKFAYELYPQAAEWEVRDLAVEVRCFYAQAIGLETWETGWFDAEPQVQMARITQLVQTRQIAFMADAMLQGMTGQEAWAWAAERLTPNAGGFIWERAVHYGIKPSTIKPYPCGKGATDE